MKALLLIFLSVLIQGPGGGVYDLKTGKRVGEVRQSPVIGDLEFYDRNGKRIGVGRAGPSGGSIRIYDPTTWKPRYEIIYPRVR